MLDQNWLAKRGLLQDVRKSFGRFCFPVRKMKTKRIPRISIRIGNISRYGVHHSFRDNSDVYATT